MTRTILSLFLAAAALHAQLVRQQADLIVRNAKVVTLESPATAQAIAMKGERIIGIGANAAMAEFIGRNTRIIDAKGALVIPGFIEGHGHFMGLGQFQRNLNLRDAR